MIRGRAIRETPLEENVLALPFEHPAVDLSRPLPFRMMPGMFAAQLYPARETAKGGLLLPSAGGGWESEGSMAERLRPDAATILAVGDAPPEGWNTGTKRREQAAALRGMLTVGDRVLLRPWSGQRFECHFGIKGLTFIGQTDPWAEDAVMVMIDGQWRPLSNWCMVRLDKAPLSAGLVTAKTLYDVTATVLDHGPTATVQIGQRVVVSDDRLRQSEDDVKWLRTKWGEWGEDVWLVREIDCEGERRIVAELPAAASSPT